MFILWLKQAAIHLCYRYNNNLFFFLIRKTGQRSHYYWLLSLGLETLIKLLQTVVSNHGSCWGDLCFCTSLSSQIRMYGYLLYSCISVFPHEVHEVKERVCGGRSDDERRTKLAVCFCRGKKNKSTQQRMREESNLRPMKSNTERDMMKKSW